MDLCMQSYVLVEIVFIILFIYFDVNNNVGALKSVL